MYGSPFMVVQIMPLSSTTRAISESPSPCMHQHYVTFCKYLWFGWPYLLAVIIQVCRPHLDSDKLGISFDWGMAYDNASIIHGHDLGMNIKQLRNVTTGIVSQGFNDTERLKFVYQFSSSSSEATHNSSTRLIPSPNACCLTEGATSSSLGIGSDPALNR